MFSVQKSKACDILCMLRYFSSMPDRPLDHVNSIMDAQWYRESVVILISSRENDISLKAWPSDVQTDKYNYRVAFLI